MPRLTCIKGRSRTRMTGIFERQFIIVDLISSYNYLCVHRVVLWVGGEAALALVVVDAQDESFPLKPLHTRHQPIEGIITILKNEIDKKKRSCVIWCSSRAFQGKKNPCPMFNLKALVSVGIILLFSLKKTIDIVIVAEQALMIVQ